LALALGICIALFAQDAKKNLSQKVRLKEEVVFQKVFDLAVGVILASLAGARIFYVLENHQKFLGKWREAFFIWQGGLVYYGGLFGAVLAACAWFKFEKWPMAYSFDLVSPYILLGQAIGRIGCFLNGCCYGNVSQPYGMVFPGGEDQLPHLPTQLWEMAGDLILFFLLLWMRRWTIRYPWMSLSLYGLTYGILRFVIEFWRRDWDKTYLFLFNSASQAVSGILIITSLVMILWSLYSTRNSSNVSAKNIK
jgi:phosphatidylglycerol:prolipoprotein diacylglycerol transferase